MSGKGNNLSREIDSSKKKVSMHFFFSKKVLKNNFGNRYGRVFQSVAANGGFGSDRRNWEESELLSPEQLHTLVNTRHELLWQEQRQERFLPRAKTPRSNWRTPGCVSVLLKYLLSINKI